MSEKILITSVINHYDTWGNDTDGYTVSDSFCHSIDKVINSDNDSILDFLLEQGFLSSEADISNIDFIDSVDTLYINQSDNGMPLFTIQYEVRS